MYCYKYHKTTGELLGKQKRQLDPIEKVYLMPANGTLSEPPKYDKEKESVFFIDGSWIVKMSDKYIKNKLREKNDIGARINILNNGEIEDRQPEEVKLEESEIKLANIKSEAEDILAGYCATLTKKILLKIGMTAELAYIENLESIAENGVSDIDNPEFPKEP